jgi:hypothetical protein
MANISIDIPDDLITQLDHRAKHENRSRSELLCKAAQQYLGLSDEPSAKEPKLPPQPTQWTAAQVTEYLLAKGVVTRGCPGLDTLLGPVTGPVDMERVLEIGKKLKGLSQQIIDDREDRV